MFRDLFEFWANFKKIHSLAYEAGEIWGVNEYHYAQYSPCIQKKVTN